MLTGPDAPVVTHEDPLRGWTIAGLDALAGSVTARRRHWWQLEDLAGIQAAAWEGITWELLTAPVPPGRDALARAGLGAACEEARLARRHRSGVHHGAAVMAPRFAAYWQPGCRPDLAEAVCERIAMTQILPALPRYQRDALHALAVYGGYQEAAMAMGLSCSAFQSYISLARRAFLVLWHEGETPSRQWRKDKRVFRRQPLAEVTA